MSDQKALMRHDIGTALTSVFGGQSVKMKRKQIRTLIDKNRPEAEAVIHRYGYDNVVRVVMDMLNNRAFPIPPGATTDDTIEKEDALSTGDCWPTPIANQDATRCQQCRGLSPSKGATKAEFLLRELH